MATQHHAQVFLAYAVPGLCYPIATLPQTNIVLTHYALCPLYTMSILPDDNYVIIISQQPLAHDIG